MSIKSNNDDYLSSTISSSTLEIVLDDRSVTDSGDDDSMDQARQSTAGTTGTDQSECRRKKATLSRDHKSHRLIEKRRRDRMNTCLNELLQLTPHNNIDPQRRIEKTEIIEMAIKHVKHLISTVQEKSKTVDSNVESYRLGYRNGLADLFEFLDQYSDSDQLLMELTEHFKEKEVELKALSDLPDRKRPKYLSISDRRIKSLRREQPSKSNRTDEQLCVISHVEGSKPHDHPSTAKESNVKVPVFVLHPSGTHYIPMCIDSSLVSHAFKKPTTNPSCSSSATDQAQCHPVSIPVNFSPLTASSDSYELDVQNINVIGSRHQTSVRPN